MTDWNARARTEILKAPHPPTDKTDRTRLSSVSSVPAGAALDSAHRVSSVSSVGVVALFENAFLADELMAAAMRACDHHGDSLEARAQMREDIDATPPHHRGDLLAHFKETYKDKIHD